jgi:glycosyltransferase involved in cell wall biosynthesis
MARAFSGEGCEVEVFAGGLESDLGEVPVHFVRPDRDTAAVLDEVSAGASEARDASLVGEISLLLRDRALETALERVHRARPFDLVYEQLSPFGLGARRFSRVARIPHALEVRAPLVEDSARRGTLALEALARAVEGRLLHAADGVFCVSERIARRARDLGAPPEKVRVLPHGVDPSRFHPDVSPNGMRRRFSSADAFVVGAAGALEPGHGVEFLVEAFADLRASVPRAALVLVGGGELRDRVEDLVHELDLDGAVAITGWVPHEEVPAHLAAFDAIVAPYPPIEPLESSTTKVVEAMAVGKPVVVPDLAELREVVESGATGFAYRPADPGDLVRALRSLAEDPGLARRIGQAAFRAARSSRTWAAGARAVLEATLAVRA